MDTDFSQSTGSSIKPLGSESTGNSISSRLSSRRGGLEGALFSADSALPGSAASDAASEAMGGGGGALLGRFGGGHDGRSGGLMLGFLGTAGFSRLPWLLTGSGVDDSDVDGGSSFILGSLASSGGSGPRVEMVCKEMGIGGYV